MLSRATLNPWLALGACFIGGVLGDMAMYGIGRKFGRKLLAGHGYFASLLSAEREREIVTLLGQGLSTRDVAERLTLSLRTVEGHVYRAMTKTGTTSRQELVALLSRRVTTP